MSAEPTPATTFSVMLALSCGMPLPTPWTVIVVVLASAPDAASTTTVTFCAVPLARMLLDGKKLQLVLAGSPLQVSATFTLKPTCDVCSVKVLALLGLPGATVSVVADGAPMLKSPTFMTTACDCTALKVDPLALMLKANWPFTALLAVMVGAGFATFAVSTTPGLGVHVAG